ncbi:sulfite reductase subunit alpha [Pseudoalteromonas fenneropenaei]|uniref:NADPH--hemoprotein reductase n=1 Tax=Pseudoalteromonas fenneropenaei TaxID=1737459 RepID=A0ABV7CJ71_9GAMM
MLSAAPYLYASLLVAGYTVFTLWCYRASLQRRWLRNQHGTVPLVVAYASESGAAETLAQQLSQQLVAQGLSCQCLTLNQLTDKTLSTTQKLLVLASTYGQGEAPDNGRHFIARLTHSAVTLNHLAYAVLALGDRDYPQFCQFGLNLDAALTERGATALFAPVLVDKLASDSLHTWYQALQQAQILAAEPAALKPKAYLGAEFTLARRQWLNVGSQGAPLYDIAFSLPPDVTWQAGDIACLHLDHKMREYSIASVPAEGELRLLVREQRHPDGRLGLGSGWLCVRSPVGATSLLSIRRNVKFHAPATNRKMILIGNGSGLAGLRAHIKQRALQGHYDNWLIYGERSPEHDLPWDDELQTWLKTGVLAELDRAFSRAALPLPVLAGRVQQGYVQDVLRSHSEQLLLWLEEGAAVYICGSLQGMAGDVEALFTELLGERGLSALEAQGRYCRDVY